MANGSGTFALIGHYAWSDPSHESPALVGTTAITASVAFTAVDQYKTKILGLAHIDPPSWVNESAIFEMYLVRDIGGADTYTTNKDHGTVSANIGLVSADLHYQSEKSGTVLEYPTP